MFPNAELIIHEVEAAFWLDRALQPSDPERIVGNSKKQRAVTAPYRDRIRRIKDGEVLPGITAMLRPGHTPGHTNWLIQSGGERLLIWGDIVHLAAVQLARPEAQADLRRRHRTWPRPHASGCSIGRRASGLCVAGAHLGFPGFGSVNAAAIASRSRRPEAPFRSPHPEGTRERGRLEGWAPSSGPSFETRPAGAPQQVAYSPATFGITSFENSRSERSAISTGMLPGVKCSDTLSMPPTLSL